jgi:hypothetical protein
VADVQPGADVLREQHVAGDDALFGDGRPASQPQHGGDLPFVHLGAGGEAGLLRVLGHHAVERLDVFEGAAHEDGIVDADAVVGEDPDLGAGISHRAELGQLLPRQANRHGADRPDVHPAGGTAEGVHLLHDAGGVRHRRAVGHRVNGRVAAQGGGAGPGLNRFGVLAAGFAQVGVDVDHAGQGHQSGGLENGGAVSLEVLAALGDEPVADQQVLGRSAQNRGTPDEVGAAVDCVLLLYGHQWLSCLE